MTREELDFIGSMNMCDEISNEAYKKIVCHCEEQEPCEDAISRQAVLDKKELVELEDGQSFYCISPEDVETLPPVTPQPKTGHCKDCKYFEYDSVAKVDGIPLIVAHEICNKWGDGCKTKEDGYCFLFEPQESEDKE